MNDITNIMSLNRFTVLTVLCIAMTPSTQALESSKQRKAGCEISTFHYEEERFQFVIVRFWQPNIEELWVCDAGLDLNLMFEELRLHIQCGNISNMLELFCIKTLPGLNKLEITKPSNDTDYTVLARVVAKALNKTKFWKNKGHIYFVYFKKHTVGVILGAATCFYLVWKLLLYLYELIRCKLRSLLTRRACKTPTIPFSMICIKKHRSEECLQIEHEVSLNLNNLNTNETHNDSTSIGVIKSSNDHNDIQTNHAAIIPKLHSPQQDVINTNKIVIKVNHEALISRNHHSSDQDDTYTNQTDIEANHEASTSRKSLSSDKDDNFINSTCNEANHEVSICLRPHTSDQDVINTNQTGIEANHEASTSRKSLSSDKDDNFINSTGNEANQEVSICRRPHSSDQDDIYTNQTDIEANHEASSSRNSLSSDQDDNYTNSTGIKANHKASTRWKPHSSDQDVIITNKIVIEANHETSISRKPHRPYQVSVNQIGGMEKEVDVNLRTSFISFDQASCNLSNETKLTSTSQAPLTSNMVDNRQSTCSSDISFRTVSVCDYDLSSLSVSSADSGCLDDRTEPDEESSSEQGLVDARFNRESL